MTMRTRNADPNPNRTSSADHARSSNSLEPDSSFFLLRRRTNWSSQPDDSEPVSPSYGAASNRPRHSDNSNRSNLEIVANSPSSSLSLGIKFPPNVSDWNEKVQRDTRRSPGDVPPPPRHSADPPRPAREGFEWVWFPAGYWAEREQPESTVKKRKSRKWFVKSPDRRSNSSSPFRNRNKSAPDTAIPQITIGGSASNGNSSPTSGKVTVVQGETTNSPGSRLKRSLFNVSPTHSHSTPPSTPLEGVYRKFKRRIVSQIMGKPQTCLDTSAAEMLKALPSETTLLLEGTSSYFDSKHHGGNATKPTSPLTLASTDFRPRRGFGLAPWHRKTSQVSLLSASSSVHQLLMGSAPAATPRGELQYSDHMGKQHDRVEISEPGQPSFLPSEAWRISTPPMSRSSSPTSLRGSSFNPSPAATAEKRKAEQGPSSSNPSTEIHPPTGSRIKEEGHSPRNWWEADNNGARAEAAAGLAQIKQTLELDMSLPPEHLPGSPLCPKSPMHKGKGLGICVYHGRRKSVIRGTMDGRDSPEYACEYFFYDGS